MIALGVRQPWAHAVVALGVRELGLDAPVIARGPVLLYASGTCDGAEYEAARSAARTRGIALPPMAEVPLGAIVALVTLVDPAPAGDDAGGPFRVGVGSVEPFEVPIHYPGALGIFGLHDASWVRPPPVVSVVMGGGVAGVTALRLARARGSLAVAVAPAGDPLALEAGPLYATGLAAIAAILSADEIVSAG